MGVLNDFVATADVSVWVNKDGKFNVARLGTDIASGVVLGTVGGLVSNAIIKKNQMEKGMDGYYCTVGDDFVADYGDEFTIRF
jgi:NhaP-type Na+/H+ and K+/H+ antiporter